MKFACVPFVKSLLAATVVLSGLASAVEAPAAAPAKADPAKGATLFTDGDASRSIPACVSCHGAAGNSTIVQNPKLSGQIEAYVTKQLIDFTTPNRANPVMTPYAKALTDDEKRNIAAYLATQQSKPNAARSKDTLDLGKKIYRGGIAEKGVAACASCHGPAGAGIPTQYPRLAGQHGDYTVAQLVAFKSGARKNSVQMSALSKRMSDDEMKAVADYIAGLK
ncbi:cytochrome c4 [Massilia arenosa]|uniref:Cytochrome c4 n=1 Tax=Zemynaea arenosa TaxID=2561931 RepID=A0A4Y9SE58_9BURK|nr:c-type cytochrome [Massilia arenosa]TFW21075.1 cytochrome c4 [Massilia arenosa]